jgi:ribonuclease D
LIQVASEKESWLVDPTAFTREDLRSFAELCTAPDILKIMHASYADQECFYSAYGFIAQPVLDTSVAAALTGLGDSPGLGKLLKDLLKISLPKGRARAQWLLRPLPRELKIYAEQDVAFLVRLGDVLLDRLDKLGRREWALDESGLESKTFEVSPKEMAIKMAKGSQMARESVGVLIALVTWRENLARRIDRPRNWIVDNETLIALAKVKPKSLEELRSFRGLNPKEIEKSGQDILSAIRKGEGLSSELPETNGGKIPSKEEERSVDFIRAYVGILADRHQIAPRFLLSSDRVFALLRSAEKGESEWVRRGLLSKNAAALIGAELSSLLRGKRALAFRSGTVETLTLDS